MATDVPYFNRRTIWHLMCFPTLPNGSFTSVNRGAPSGLHDHHVRWTSPISIYPEAFNQAKPYSIIEEIPIKLTRSVRAHIHELLKDF